MPTASNKQQSTLAFSSTGRLTVRQPPAKLNQQIDTEVSAEGLSTAPSYQDKESPTPRSTFFGHLLAVEMEEPGHTEAGRSSEPVPASQGPGMPSSSAQEGKRIKLEPSPSPPRQSTIPFNTQKLRWVPYTPVQAGPSSLFSSQPKGEDQPSKRPKISNSPPSQIPQENYPSNNSHDNEPSSSSSFTTRQHNAEAYAETQNIQKERLDQQWNMKFAKDPKARWKAYIELHKIPYPKLQTFEPDVAEETICREYCKSHFLLTHADLLTLPYNPQPNPMDESYEPMKLHRLHDVCDLAFRKQAVLAGIVPGTTVMGEDEVTDPGDVEAEFLGRGRDIFLDKAGPINDVLDRLDQSIAIAVARNEKRRAIEAKAAAEAKLAAIRKAHRDGLYGEGVYDAGYGVVYDVSTVALVGNRGLSELVYGNDDDDYDDGGWW